MQIHEYLIIGGVVTQGVFCIIGTFLFFLFKSTMQDFKEWLTKVENSVNEVKEVFVPMTVCERMHEGLQRELKAIFAPLTEFVVSAQQLHDMKTHIVEIDTKLDRIQQSINVLERKVGP